MRIIEHRKGKMASRSKKKSSLLENVALAAILAPVTLGLMHAVLCLHAQGLWTFA